MYRVKVLNDDNKLTMSRLMDRDRAEKFAQQIWNTNTFSSLKWVCVESKDGMIIQEWEK